MSWKELRFRVVKHGDNGLGDDALAEPLAIRKEMYQHVSTIEGV